MKVISQRGFTLLEILLAITIMGVVVSAATIAINSSIKVAEITQNEKKNWAAGAGCTPADY